MEAVEQNSQEQSLKHANTVLYFRSLTVLTINT